MDFMDELGNLLPFVIFTLIVVLGNLGDKKKPKVKIKTKPFPKGQKLPDIKPPAGNGPDVPQPVQIEMPAPMPQPPVQIDAEVPAPIPQPELPRKHRGHHPDEYEQVHNTYQSYLEKKYPQGEPEAKASHAQRRAANEVQAQQPSRQGGNFAGLENLSLAQAILSAEILGAPKSRRHRRY